MSGEMYQAGLQVAFINRWKRKRVPRIDESGISTPVSGVQVDSPRRGTPWRRWRHGSSRYSVVSKTSQDSAGSQTQFGDIEEEFLHSAEFGDIHNVKRILNEYPDFNVDCIDALGRTALRLAVKNEHLEVVEALLEKSNTIHIYEAVLQAISADHSQIAATILKHRRYLEMWKERKKLGDTGLYSSYPVVCDYLNKHSQNVVKKCRKIWFCVLAYGFYKTAFLDSQFSPDITPLILAAQKNQYEIVQLLLIRGENIMKPHKFSCGCQECRNKMKFDQLRLAKYRLNAYKGLASEAYISLSSKDPILTAFELAAELRRLSKIEKHFKKEYRDLADHLSDYVVKLLDRVRTQKELELVLNKTGKEDEEEYESLARFKLALNYKEKKFVAHPSCQQRVVRTWYNGMGKLERASWPRRLSMTGLFICAYPFLVILHVFCPGTKGAKLLQFPVIKFLCHAMSFATFLLLIVVSTIEATQSVSKDRTLESDYKHVHRIYLLFRNYTNNTVFDENFPLRASYPRAAEILMSLWIIGMVCQECNQLYHTGFLEYTTSMYNVVDFVVISIYISFFAIKYWGMYKFSESIEFLSNENNIKDEVGTLQHFYWLNADRMFWTTSDPLNLTEGIFAIANILSFFRISYLLPANEVLGPLQISLGRMIKDIAKFLALFVLVILAFMVGLHNLFWYYSERSHIELHSSERAGAEDVKAAKHFGGVMATFRTVFWSLFGRGDSDVVKLGYYQNEVTENIGYILFGAYNVAMVTVLLNMLIAMMTRSFTLIAEDSDREWKFARSLLYMDYIGKGSVLPAPLNIIGAPKAFIRMLFCNCACCKESSDEAAEVNIEDDIENKLPPAAHANCTSAEERPYSRPPLVKDISSDSSHSVHPSESMSVGTPSKSTPRRTQPVLTNIEAEDEKLTYEKTMQRIVQRYIFDIQREAEVTEDAFDEIKQDISSFRYDLINHITTRTAVEDDLIRTTDVITQQLETLKVHLGLSPSSETSNNEDKSLGKFAKRKNDILSAKLQADVHAPQHTDSTPNSRETEAVCEVAKEENDLENED